MFFYNSLFCGHLFVPKYKLISLNQQPESSQYLGQLQMLIWSVSIFFLSFVVVVIAIM